MGFGYVYLCKRGAQDECWDACGPSPPGKKGPRGLELLVIPFAARWVEGIIGPCVRMKLCPYVNPE